MRRAWLGAALMVAACGGGPARPTPPATTSSGALLAAGAYILRLSNANVLTCENGICTSISLCVNLGPGPLQREASILVTVQRDGDRATVVPATAGDSMRVTLNVGVNSAAGNISGTATTTSGSSVTASGTLEGSVSAAPDLPGVPQGSGAVGLLRGDLSIGGTSCSNPTHNWVLTAR
jgi:hypothetical protein